MNKKKKKKSVKDIWTIKTESYNCLRPSDSKATTSLTVTDIDYELSHSSF